MDPSDAVVVPLLPSMMVRLIRVAAVNMGRDAALKEALIPLIPTFRRDGDLAPIILKADEVLGEDWLAVGFEHASRTQYDERIRRTVEYVRTTNADQS